MSKLKLQQLAFKVIAWTFPLAWLAWITFGRTAGLGPDPFDTINKRLGDSTIYLLLANLYIGMIIFFFRPLPGWARALPRIRRSIGVACFFYASLHVIAYVLREGGDPLHAWSEITSRSYLIAGSVGWLILCALAITSNDFSVRKLKAKLWRAIHKLVYIALIAAAIHQLLIEKANILWAIYYFAPIGALYLLRIAIVFTRQFRQKRANS